ncbi:MFS transporter [Compostibacter hankyongensis]|uniref:MFS transporter n=1 Tax=Compostibacter hankyongensis TaxID=1007089 RepID=UPI0031E927A1
MESIPSRNDPYAALRHPEFRHYIITRFAIVFALNMQSTLVGWKIYELTRDPLSLGLIGLAELIPALSLALPAGHYVDGHEKRNMLLRCEYIYAACGLSYVVFTSGFALHHLSLALITGIIYLTTFAGGVVRAFNGPTSFSLMSLVVPRELYPNATTWSSSAWQSGAVLGPLTGGLLYAWTGTTFSFGTVVLFHLLAMISLAFIRPKPVFYKKQGEKVWASLTEGIRFVFRTREVLGALSLDMFAVLFGGAVALLPVYADKILHVGAEGLGALRAAPAVGSCVTLLLLAFIPLNRKAGLKLLGAVFGFGLSILVFGLSRSFLLSLGALFLSGVCDGVSVVIRNTILQLKTPDEMRGRVSAVHSMFVGSSNEFGSFESGVTARWMGTVPAVVFGGCMTLVVVLAMYFVSPSLRKLQLK